jgi:mono/diheme cytochrome c family protein
MLKMTVIGGVVLAAVTTNALAVDTERGAYLATTIGDCGGCHTPRDAAPQIIPNMTMAGGEEFDVPGLGHVIVPNITPDPDTGIGKWSESQIVNALRNGKRPDGKLISPPMPIPVYRQMSDNDAIAIAAYLKGLTPVHHVVPRMELQIALPPDYGPEVTHVDEPDPTNKVAYGRYLVAIGHCVLCHTPAFKDGPPDMGRAFSGGRELPDSEQAGAFTVSRNITSDPINGIGKWSDEEIKASLTECIRPDRTKLHTMPCDAYFNITSNDLDAIVAFLRTVPAVKNP